MARAEQALAIDIATELAEGFALPPGGVPTDVLAGLVLPGSGRVFHPRHAAERFDEQVLPLISSAHLACGLHSGDPLILQRIVPALVARGVQIGAHPSYPDVFNFAQTRIDMDRDDLVAVILYQLGALQGVLGAHGARLRHVKCHGALAFDVAEEPWACAALIRAIDIFDPSMTLVVLAGTPGVEQARASGVPVVEEAYIDRGYDSKGRLLPRNHPKALIADAGDAARQLVGIARDGSVVADDGTRVPLTAKTFIIHSDTPAAGAFAKAAADALKRENIEIRPLNELL